MMYVTRRGLDKYDVYKLLKTLKESSNGNIYIVQLQGYIDKDVRYTAYIWQGIETFNEVFRKLLENWSLYSKWFIILENKVFYITVNEVRRNIKHVFLVGNIPYSGGSEVDIKEIIKKYLTQLNPTLPIFRKIDKPLFVKTCLEKYEIKSENAMLITEFNNIIKDLTLKIKEAIVYLIREYAGSFLNESYALSVVYAIDELVDNKTKIKLQKIRRIGRAYETIHLPKEMDYKTRFSEYEVLLTYYLILRELVEDTAPNEVIFIPSMLLTLIKIYRDRAESVPAAKVSLVIECVARALMLIFVEV